MQPTEISSLPKERRDPGSPWEKAFRVGLGLTLTPFWGALSPTSCTGGWAWCKKGLLYLVCISAEKQCRKVPVE